MKTEARFIHRHPKLRQLLVLAGLASTLGLGTTATEAHANFERHALEARVQTVRQSLQLLVDDPTASTDQKLAQWMNWGNWNNWNNWPNWANWGNWLNR